MVIKTEITKEVFESYVPAAKMPERNSSVFTRLETAFERAYDGLVRSYIGQTYVDSLETEEKSKENVKALVCIIAFIQSARSLDLVLTSTGFGIVRTDSTAPASQERVDALLRQMRLEQYERIEVLIKDLIAKEGWGATSQASRNISTLFWGISQMQSLTWLEYSADKWLWCIGQTIEADRWIRKTIGDEYANELVSGTRNGNLNATDASAADIALRIMGTLIGNAETNTPPHKSLFDELIRFVEDHAEDIPTYKNSKIYQARHHEGFKNQQEDSTYFFM